MTFVRERDGGFFAVAALVGVAVGAGAALLISSLRWVAAGFSFVAENLMGGSPWFSIVSVVVGISLAWWIGRTFAPEVQGDGVPEAVAGVQTRGGYLSTRSIPFKILATALTLGSGGSAGREGPIVQVGGAIGSSISRHLGLGESHVRSLVAAGAGAGIGASFNAPIAGMLFALEVILGSFGVRHMSAIVIASVAAAVTSRSLLPGEAFISAGTYRLEDPRELILYLGLAMVVVVFAYLFLRLLSWVEKRAETLSSPAWARPVTLALLVGLVAAVEPRVAGDGLEFVSELLTNLSFQEGIQDTFPDFTVVTWWVVALLAGAKLVATALTISSGGSGGAFMPSLFIGASLGTAFAQLLAPVWTVSTLQPGAFAVVGMAAFFAAVARAPLTAILLVFEVTQAREYRLILPLMLATVVATFVTDRLHRESVYTLPLARRGIKLVRVGEVDLLDTVTVGDVMVPPPAVARPDMSLAEAHEAMLRSRAHGLPVVEDGRLVGVVTVSDIHRVGGPDPDRKVKEAMTAKPLTVDPNTPVSHALERMAVLGVGRLPVVSAEDPDRLVGWFRREEAVKAYHQALGVATDQRLVGERLRQRTEPGARYFDFRIPPGSIADGRTVGEVPWPEGCTLVAVRRGTDVLVPRGSTVLHRGDVVTAFGTEAARELVIRRLNEGAEEPTAEIRLDEQLEVDG
ncbi:MAG: transport integral membrane protein [Acidimicrobiia bacterium]|nr:MAG: transport integral membrane protein [Acidimicrobiia bacterium]